MSRDSGGPAFPLEGSAKRNANSGMSLRDYFAAKALQGMSANPYYDDYEFDTISEMAYAQAEAMLAARSA